MVSHLDPPRQVTHPLRSRRRRLWLCPRLLPLAVIGERPRSPFLDGSIVNRNLGVGRGSPFAVSALSVAYIM
jgi:hypothetical protein